MHVVDIVLTIGVRRAIERLRKGGTVHDAEICLEVALWTALGIEAKGAL
jgi:hypothetical protein